MSNTITIELCAEDRARLDRLAEALERRHDCDACTKGIVDYVAHVTRSGAEATTENHTEAPAEKPAEPDTIPAEEEKPVEVKSEPAAEAPKVERSDIQKKVVELSQAGKKAEVRDIVKAYADKVSTIPEDKLAEVLEKLTALEG